MKGLERRKCSIGEWNPGKSITPISKWNMEPKNESFFGSNSELNIELQCSMDGVGLFMQRLIELHFFHLYSNHKLASHASLNTFLSPEFPVPLSPN